MIMSTITQDEIDGFWKFYKKTMFKWNSVSFYGLITGSVVLCLIAKHVFKDKSIYCFLNDTVDGDFGGEWWLEREGLKPGIISMIRWWFRNHSWNYITKFNPEWKSGSVDIVNGQPEMKIIHCDVDVERFQDKYFHWLTREDGIGKISIAYRINGRVYCRYSEVKQDRFGRLVQIQRGAGGERYRFNKKPIL